MTKTFLNTYFKRSIGPSLCAGLFLLATGLAGESKAPRSAAKQRGRSEAGSGANIDAADVVAAGDVLKSAEAVVMKGVTVYPRPVPAHPLAALAEKEPPGPPQLPRIDLEARRSNSSIIVPPRTDRISTTEEMNAALQKLRTEHEPYLREFTPKLPATRVRVDLSEFDFRYEREDDRKNFALPLSGEGKWEKVRIPHFVGPIGNWAAFYRTDLRIPDAFWKEDRYILHMNGADYWSQVYLNGRCVGTHTGSWAPCELDLTPYLDRNGKNVLLVRVENDFRMRVNGGEKIYAATGPGFDNPQSGWNPSSTGAGLWQKCWLEARPAVHITDLFVIADEKQKTAEVHVTVNNLRGGVGAVPIDLKLDVYGKNFEGVAMTGIPVQAEPAGGKESEYVAVLKFEEIRTWTPEHPWLYTIRASVAPAQPKAGPAAGKSTVAATLPATKRDYFESHFGMHSFRMDMSSTPKGRLLLNGEPVILRGADDMSAFFQDVIRGDTEQLIKDVLIFKLAHLNFIRLCQHPRQPEAYDMFDRLGIMVQTDLPIFGEVRRPLIAEEIKQAIEMEKLVRSHPSNIMVSLINEPGGRTGFAQRHLERRDIHRFFDASVAGIGVMNPSRVVKPIDGDYMPPSPGFPDDHLYTMWYVDHGVPMGRLVRGYWKTNKSGWYMGCGEWGVAAQENAACMFKYFPEAWLPKGTSLESPWAPNPADGDLAARHFAWYDKQENLGQYIAVSQAHQFVGIDWCQRAMRRQSDRIISTAQFFLIEGWPNNCQGFGIVDYLRNPKPAYYALREACNPLLADIRTDRLHYFGGEKLAVEFWVCNDRKAPFEKGKLVWQVTMNGKTLFTQSAGVRIPSWGPSFVGYFPYLTPEVKQRGELIVSVALLDPDGKNISDYGRSLGLFPRPNALAKAKIAVLGDPKGRVAELSSRLGFEVAAYQAGSSPELLIVDDAGPLRPDRAGASRDTREQLLAYLRNGGKMLVLPQQPATEFNLGDGVVKVSRMANRHFVSRKTGHPAVAGFQAQDFAYWYNPAVDYMDAVADAYVEGENLKPILLSGDGGRRPTFNLREDICVDAELQCGKGRVVFSQVLGLPRLDHEPVPLHYYRQLIGYLTQ